MNTLLCAWCASPATGEMTISPARYGTVRGDRVLKATERRAPVCEGCREQLRGGGL